MAAARPDTKKIKATAGRLRDAMRMLHLIEKDSQILEKSIKKAADALAEEQLAEFLSGLGVEELNRDKRGIRISALKNAGIENIGQLYKRSKGSLENIEGIGQTNAALIHHSVQTIAASARENMHIKLSAGKNEKELTRLIELLHQYSAAAQARMAAEELLADFSGEVDTALSASSRALSTLGWLFSSAAQKKQAGEAAVELFALADCGFVEKSRLVYTDFQQSKPVGNAMEEFRKNSAPFAVTLEYVSGMGAAGDTGAVPAELAQAVSARKADLSLLKATLRPYQLFGTKYILNQKNTLLGDEMGLGKTMQAIAAMAALKKEGHGHFLVVCPASVLVNWCREIEKFSLLPVTEIHGADKIDELYDWLHGGCVAVTTYETARSLPLPDNFRLGLLIADEAHYIKNPAALRTRAVLGLCGHAENLLFMTGTPLENRVDEMCALLDILSPQTAIKARELRYISDAPQFRESIAGVYLRRTREDVLTELPDKIEKDQWCRPTAEDWKWYFAEVFARNFMGMRRIGWHTEQLEKSSKAQRLREITELARQEGRKVLIFSYFRETAEKALKIAGENAFGPITGSVPSAKRQEIVDAFTAAPDGAVLVCQITAGGTGLNIQAASVVVFCEPQIKPSLETQAVSRAYRMGQARSVLVYRLLCEGTVDDDMVSMLRDKQDIFDSFADESVAGRESLADADMRKWIDELIDAQMEKLRKTSLP
ncbi:MAG: DEAD/DEAH box helicase [Oscillospiraceae bacterium]|nr:DEAD/DEAH box helicase [Oscillospiraceae bacterium]